MYVDFPINQPNPYLDALSKIDSPFEQSWCFHGKFKGAWKKWRSRVRELNEIKQIVAELKPDQVFVGSDRRIEFQCAMTEAVKHKPEVKGIYLMKVFLAIPVVDARKLGGIVCLILG
ncbi:hypothetical protein THIOSC15_2440005 [uncultured Thiomicrorhabdus sp.]